MSVFHCGNGKAITHTFKALYCEVLGLMQDFLLSLKHGKEFQKCFDNDLGFFCGTFFLRLLFFVTGWQHE